MIGPHGGTFHIPASVTQSTSSEEPTSCFVDNISVPTKLASLSTEGIEDICSLNHEIDTESGYESDKEQLAPGNMPTLPSPKHVSTSATVEEPLLDNLVMKMSPSPLIHDKAQLAQVPPMVYVISMSMPDICSESHDCSSVTKFRPVVMEDTAEEDDPVKGWKLSILENGGASDQNVSLAVVAPGKPLK